MKNTPPPPAKILVSGAKLTRRRAEKISAVEGLRLSPKMAAHFKAFDQKGLTPEERRAAIRAEFTKSR